MRYALTASFFVLVLLAYGLGASSGQDTSTPSADEQVLKAANVGTDGPALLAYLKKQTLTVADRQRAAVLVKQLGAGVFAQRARASAELLALGPKVIALVRPALKDGDAEIARRAEQCLAKLEAEANDKSSVLAAVRLLAERRPTGAVEALLDYLPFADQDALVDEIEHSLAQLAVRDGKTEPALIAALKAPEALLRGIAGVALTRASAKEQKAAVHKLLLDPDAGVRLRVGMALLLVRDKAAVPTLIDLLAQLPADELGPVLDLLGQIAGKDSPDVSLGASTASQKKCRDAWTAWWADNQASLTIPVLDGPRPLLGYTMVVIANSNQVLEVDQKGKVRWVISGLGCPFHAQMLPGERILIAEAATSRITERNTKGDILWQANVPNQGSNIQCQRLANGNTLVLTPGSLLEVDRKGQQRQVFVNNSPGSVIAAKRVLSGQTVVVTGDGTCLKLNSAGKEITRFHVGKVSNNCLDALPNGNVLIANMFEGKVTEFNAQGKVVWQAKCPFAFAPQRLPGGNTLVACLDSSNVVELDRNGKVVWEYRTESPNHRPWFASRR